MMKKVTTFIVFLASFTLQAQQDFVASGGEATGTGGGLSFSIGQLNYEAVSSTSGIVSQGVQQAFEVFLQTPDLNPNLTVGVYPNPTTNYVTVQLDFSKFSRNSNYELYDLNGKSIKTGTISGNETQINMDNLPATVYFLNINDKTKIKTFKIIKQN